MNTQEITKQLRGAVRRVAKARKASALEAAAQTGTRDSLGRKEYAEQRKELFVPLMGEQIKSNPYTEPKLRAAYVKAFEAAQA